MISAPPELTVGERALAEAVLVGRCDLLDRIAAGELKGRALGCWCAPLACHADVLLEYACPRR